MMDVIYAQDEVEGDRAALDLSHLSHVKGCDRAAVDLTLVPFSIEYSIHGIEPSPIAPPICRTYPYPSVWRVFAWTCTC